MKSGKVLASLFLLIGAAHGAHQNFQISQNTSDLGFHLESPTITNFGSWGEPESCPRGQLVTGFQLKVEPKHSVDDTALNGIRLFCGRPGSSNDNRKNITSKVGHFGNWGHVMNCSTYAAGFELQSQEPQGKRFDDVAAANFKLYCADSAIIEGFNDNGHTYQNTSYTGPQMCSSGEGICGLQTQVERYQVFGDDTSLNNVRVKCCSVVNIPEVPAVPEIPILGVPSAPASTQSTSAPAPTTIASPSVVS